MYLNAYHRCIVVLAELTSAVVGKLYLADRYFFGVRSCDCGECIFGHNTYTLGDGFGSDRVND